MPQYCYSYRLHWIWIVKQHYRWHKSNFIISFPSFFAVLGGDSTKNSTKNCPLRLSMTQQTARNAHEFVPQLFTIIQCYNVGISFSWKVFSPLDMFGQCHVNNPLDSIASEWYLTNTMPADVKWENPIFVVCLENKRNNVRSECPCLPSPKKRGRRWGS